MIFVKKYFLVFGLIVSFVVVNAAEKLKEDYKIIDYAYPDQRGFKQEYFNQAHKLLMQDWWLVVDQYGSRIPDKDRKRFWEELLEGEDRSTGNVIKLVVDNTDNVIGLAEYEKIKKDKVELHVLKVGTNRQNQGIGRNLVKSVVSDIKEKYPLVRKVTINGDEKAWGFYDKIARKSNKQPRDSRGKWYVIDICERISHALPLANGKKIKIKDYDANYFKKTHTLLMQDSWLVVDNWGRDSSEQVRTEMFKENLEKIGLTPDLIKIEYEGRRDQFSKNALS